MIVFVLAKEKVRLYFSVFLLALGLFYSYTGGTWGIRDATIHLDSFSRIPSLFSGLVLLSALVFTQQHLKIKNRSPEVDLIFIIAFVVCAIQIILAFTMAKSTLVYTVGSFLEIAVPALLLYFSIHFFVYGNKTARFLILGWGIYIFSFAASSSYFINTLNLNNIHNISTYSILLGTAISAFVLSCALTDKYIVDNSENYLRNSKYVEQIQFLQTVIDAKDEEIKRQLQVAEENQQEMEYSLKRVREQSGYDSQTHLLNHSAFVSQFQHFFNDSNRYHYPLSVLMLAIDQYDNMIKNYSTETINQVLKVIAGILQNDIRNTDLIARYDDDKFVFIMTHSNLEKTKEKGNAIKDKIRSSEITSQSDFSPSVSVGINFMSTSKTSSNFHLILERAEKAVAQAQLMGGSCLQVYLNT